MEWNIHVYQTMKARQWGNQRTLCHHFPPWLLAEASWSKKNNCLEVGEELAKIEDMNLPRLKISYTWTSFFVRIQHDMSSSWAWATLMGYAGHPGRSWKWLVPICCFPFLTQITCYILRPQKCWLASKCTMLLYNVLGVLKFGKLFSSHDKSDHCLVLSMVC